MNSTVNRISNVVVGSGLIIATMAASATPLGALAVLPLIGAALVLVGITGESPVSRISQASNLANGSSHVRAHAA
jgi:hypothetical protein